MKILETIFRTYVDEYIYIFDDIFALQFYIFQPFKWSEHTKKICGLVIWKNVGKKNRVAYDADYDEI